MSNSIDPEILNWIILPLLIFFARIIDVSIGTLRIAFIARNQRLIAPFLGFFEVLIWLIAISQIFKHLDNFTWYIAYAGGFAMGNYVGMAIENRLAIGQLVVRIITETDVNPLLANVKSAGYGVTLVDGQGSMGPVKILFTVIKRKELKKMIGLIKQFAPRAFYTVEDIQMARKSQVPVAGSSRKRYLLHLFKMDRKRK